MWVSRRQLPIGQGCFHTARVGFGEKDNRPSLNYIYDCGSTDRAALKEAVQVFATSTDQIAALFVSHLDDDHVCGLDQLLATVPVQSVYIPYVDQALILIELLEAERNGAVSASLIEAMIEPETWFGRRGVRRVVRVLPGGSASPDLPITEGPMPDGGVIHLKEWPAPPRPIKPRIDGSRAALLQMEVGASLLMFSGPQMLDWILHPYVDPAPNERRDAFKRAVRSALGLLPRERLSSSRISDAMRDVQQRRALKRCYEEITPSGASWAHNRVSMSLYAVPSGRRSVLAQQTRYVSCDHTWPIFRSFHNNALGWIGTGDAMLSRDSIRRPWRAAYNAFESQIGTLLLPHHGSRHNFHEEILDFPGLNLCVASAGNPSPYGHPNRAVVDQIRARGKDFTLVSQAEFSGLVELVEIN